MTKMKNVNQQVALEKKVKQQEAAIEIAEKEIYENISQCLCLARVQLGNINLEDQSKTLCLLGEANILIGKAVKDLRNLVKELMASQEK
jgi:hypothetical protein